MYKLTVFEQDQETTALVAWLVNPEQNVIVNAGTLAVKDVDDEYLIVRLADFGHISIIKDEDDA